MKPQSNVRTAEQAIEVTDLLCDATVSDSEAFETLTLKYGFTPEYAAEAIECREAMQNAEA